MAEAQSRTLTTTLHSAHCLCPGSEVTQQRFLRSGNREQPCPIPAPRLRRRTTQNFVTAEMWLAVAVLPHLHNVRCESS